MKLLQPLLLAFAALATFALASTGTPGLDETVPNAQNALCVPYWVLDKWTHAIPWGRNYTVIAVGVPSKEIPMICRKLWNGINQFAIHCALKPQAYCEEITPGVLEWHFTGPVSCNRGMLRAAWWEGTHNKWGALVCPRMKAYRTKGVHIDPKPIPGKD